MEKGKLRQFIKDLLTFGINFRSRAAAPDAVASRAQLYGKDDSGTTKLYYKDSAGTEYTLGEGSGGESVGWTAPGAGEIATSGSLGVGMTSSPGAALEINVSDSDNKKGLFIDFDETGNYNALHIDSESTNYYGAYVQGKYGVYVSQDAADGQALRVERDLADAGTYSLATFVDENTSNEQSTVFIRQDGTGLILECKDGGDPAFAIADGGKIGCATTSPIASLEVGAGYGDRYALENIAVTVAGGNDAALDLLEETANSSGFGTSAAFGFRLVYDGGDNALYLKSGAGATVNTCMSLARSSGDMILSSSLLLSGGLDVGLGYSHPTSSGVQKITVRNRGEEDSALDLVENTSDSQGGFGGSNTYGFRLVYDGGDNTLYLKSGQTTSVNTRVAVIRDSGAVIISGSTVAQNVSATGELHVTGSISVGAPDTQYGFLQVNQSADSNVGGISVKNSGGGRSARIWCDSSNRAIFNAGSTGAATLWLNNGQLTAYGVESEMHLSGAVVFPTARSYTSFSFETHWAVYGGDWARGRYSKDSMGYVHLQGLVKSTSDSAAGTVTILPAGFRPGDSRDHIFVCLGYDDSLSSYKMVRVDVYDGGSVSVNTNTLSCDDGDWVSLDGITFYAGF